MEESEKNLSENLKNLDFSRLILKNFYAELFINQQAFPVYIISEKENHMFDICFQDKRGEVSLQMLNIFGDNDYPERETPINSNFYQKDTLYILNLLNGYLSQSNLNINLKNNHDGNEINSTTSSAPLNTEESNHNKLLDSKGKKIDITGFLAYQTIAGFLVDFFAVEINKLENNIHLNNFNVNDLNLLTVILDKITYLSNIVKSNLDKYKSAFFNRRLFIVSQINAILISFDSLIKNLTPKFHIIYNSNSDFEKKLVIIAKSIYEIILDSKNKWQIPLQSLIIFIKFITNEKVKECIENYDKKEIYEILNGHMKNLDKNELIYYKRDSGIRDICNELISNLFDNNMDEYIDETYYSYLLSCLKCNNLEKKMNALNDINNIINDFQNDKKINVPFKNFIENNNIIDMFFEDSIHDEVIKRSINIFAYLARYNCLNDKFIEKIIERNN